jgi:hypothetical protein
LLLGGSETYSALKMTTQGADSCPVSHCGTDALLDGSAV